LNLSFSIGSAVGAQPPEIAFTNACMATGCCAHPHAIALASAEYAAWKGILFGAKAGKRSRHCSVAFM
jgi:hypothetical protein